MNLQPQMNRNDPPRFRPPLAGCVARDFGMANALKSCYIEAFSMIAANIYRSLRCAERDRTLSELFEAIAVEELEKFRLLGELIIALGGDGELRSCRRRTGGYALRGEEANVFLEESLAERKRNIDRYETLMSKTGDRVVRSVLAKLLSGERRILDRLREHCG